MTTQLNNAAGHSGGHGGCGDGKFFNCGKAGQISCNFPKPRNVGRGWKRTPPGNGEPNNYSIDGVHHTYYGVCRRWTSGSKEHMTTTHRRGPPRTGDPLPPPVSLLPTDTSVILGLTVDFATPASAITTGHEYDGGHLSLFGAGLFVGKNGASC